MFLEADAELDLIDPFLRAAPEVLSVRTHIYRGLKRWELMHTVAKKLAEFDPDEVGFVISYAFASRRALSIEIAREILLKAVRRFPREAIIYFNLACYECQLGRLEAAKSLLNKAFEIEPESRAAALDDEDLRPIWDSLQRS